MTQKGELTGLTNKAVEVLLNDRTIEVGRLGVFGGFGAVAYRPVGVGTYLVDLTLAEDEVGRIDSLPTGIIAGVGRHPQILVAGDRVQPVYNLALSAFVGTGRHNAVSEVGVGWVVVVRWGMVNYLNRILAEDVFGCESEIVHDHEIVENGAPESAPPIVSVGLPHQLHGYEMVLLRTGLSRHQVELGLFVGVGDGGSQVGADIHVQQDNWRDWNWIVENDEANEWCDLYNLACHDVADNLFQVIEDSAALLYADHD